jgi:hypothetical protein
MLFSYACFTHDVDEKPCKLARVPLDDVLERAKWQYFAGDGWSSNIDDARTIFDGNDLMTVHWNDYLDRYVAVYSRAFSNSVVMRTAESPEGPWSAEELLFVAQGPVVGENIYDALAHAEYAQDGGRILYVTYTRATGEFQSEVRLVQVELARIE